MCATMESKDQYKYLKTSGASSRCPVSLCPHGCVPISGWDISRIISTGIKLQSTHILCVPSFFSTKIIGAPHCEELGRINFLSSNSFNCFLSSSNSPTDILYGLLAVGVVPGKRSMMNSMSHSGGIPGRSSGNRWHTWQIIGKHV